MAPYRDIENDPGVGHRVLLIDDSRLVCRTVGAALRKHGYRVCWACSLPELSMALRKFEPEVILADLNMPGARGDDICRLVKQTRPLKVVFYSSMPATEIQRRARSAGADGFVEKSENFDDLFSTIERVLTPGEANDTLH